MKAPPTLTLLSLNYLLMTSGWPQDDPKMTSGGPQDILHWIIFEILKLLMELKSFLLSLLDLNSFHHSYIIRAWLYQMQGLDNLCSWMSDSLCICIKLYEQFIHYQKHGTWSILKSCFNWHIDFSFILRSFLDLFDFLPSLERILKLSRPHDRGGRVQPHSPGPGPGQTQGRPQW